MALMEELAFAKIYPKFQVYAVMFSVWVSYSSANKDLQLYAGPDLNGNQR